MMTQRRTTLARARRPLLGAAALMCFTAAAVLSPSDVRSQLNVRQRDAIAAAAPRPETRLVAVVPAGDAFAPRASADEDAPTAIADPPGAPLPRLVRGGAVLAGAVPATSVTAIAIGSRPTAIVETGGTARVVTLGDPLEDSTIAAINDGAIRLANGRRLSLEPALSAP